MTSLFIIFTLKQFKEIKILKIMDLNNFNNKFPSWENQYKNIQNQKSLQKNIIIQSTFSEKYPNVNLMN